jgi:hypothetical protein
MLSNDLLTRLLIDAAEIASRKTLIEAGMLKPQVTQSEAYRLYGRTSVTRWIQGAKIKRIKRGNTIYLDRLRLETLSKVSKYERV